MFNSNTINDFPVLSNEDVQLLYEIVTAAEDSQSPPFRALFAAYDNVLARYGIKKEHDQVYFRFLLRMREGRTPGESLFRQFQTLLANMDIQVDINGDNDDAEKENVAPLGTQANAEHEFRKISQNSTQGLSRRASFDSVYDTLAEERRLHHDRGRDPITRPFSTDYMFREANEEQNELQSQALGQPGRESRSNEVRHQKSRRNQHAIPHLRQRAKTTDGANHVAPPRGREVLTEREHNDSLTESDSIDSNNISEAEDTKDADNVIAAAEPAANVQQKLTAKLEANSKSLRYHHMAAKALGLFRHWHSRSKRLSSNNREMLLAAQVRDSTTLQRQAFDQWRNLLLERHRIRDIENAFDVLEQKASRARDLFLMTKAFTHWAQCASDEAMRTSAARRHMLRTKYFNAWRDITVVNELKVRRQGLVKFFGIWKERAIEVYRHQEDALAFRENTMIERLYRHWFWHFCERKAPTWYMSRLKESIFKKWSAGAKQATYRRALAVDFQRILLTNKVLLPWTRSLITAQQRGEAALTYQQRSLLAACLTSLRKALTFAPLQSAFTNQVGSRNKRALFDVWLRKARAAMQASKINELRIMRNAWTTWNDELRCAALRSTIDDRVAQQALYKWVLSERFALFERMRLERIKTKTLMCWRSRANSLFEALGKAKHHVQERRDRHVSVSVLQRWTGVALDRSRDIQRAQEFWDDRLERHVSRQWIAKAQHVEKLQTWSRDARFYVLASRSITKWRDAAETSRRARRREAYTAFRRKKKMGQARSILISWREQSSAMGELHSQAEHLERERTAEVARTTLYEFREKFSTAAEMASQAQEFREHKLLQSRFDTLANAFDQTRDAERKADDFLQESVNGVAASLLRKLNWLLFQTKRQQDTAGSLAERNTKKHQRNMLRHWAETAVERRRETLPSLPNRFSPANQRRMRRTFVDADSRAGPEALQNDSILEEYTQLDRSNQLHTPAPAYLRTPSRRTTRGKSRLIGPQTPATTQITPFKSRLQTLQTGGRVHTVRGDFAKRLAGSEPRGAIDDMPETSPLRRL